VEKPGYIIINKIKILKKTKDANVGSDTHPQVPFSFGAGGFFNEDTREVIYYNCEGQYQDIDGNKIHVEKATA
jgi:hypothetical protein